MGPTGALLKGMGRPQVDPTEVTPSSWMNKDPKEMRDDELMMARKYIALSDMRGTKMDDPLMQGMIDTYHGGIRSLAPMLEDEIRERKLDNPQE